MNYYEILGLPRDATPDEIRHAYAAKAAQLLPARADGAPADVINAVNQARSAIDDAGRILGDPASCAQYDGEIDRTTAAAAHLPSGSGADGAPAGAGLVGPESFPSQEWANPLYNPLGGLEALAEWLGPHPAASRNVTVPDVWGLPATEAFYVVAKADLHINFVHMSEAQEGDGLVVGQDPPAGTSVRRHSTLTVEVVYSAEPGAT